MRSAWRPRATRSQWSSPEAGTLRIETAADNGTTIVDTYLVAPDGSTTWARGDGTPAKITKVDAEPGTYRVETMMNWVTPTAYSGTVALGDAGGDGGDGGGGGGGGGGGSGELVKPTAPPADSEIVACIVDSGLNAHHKEFQLDQVVAWFDFTKGTPAAGEYYGAGEPIDEMGHGTHVAGMAAGMNRDPAKTASFAPGTKLAIARVMDAAGTVVGDVGRPSAGASTRSRPTSSTSRSARSSRCPALRAPLGRRLRGAGRGRAKGVLVTVANGNGTGNLGLVPGDGASSNYARRSTSLAVGGAGVLDGRRLLPARGRRAVRVTGPTHDSTDEYDDAGGTSFSSPLTAGFAARLIAEARSAGRSSRPPELETLVKYSARDTEIPPIWEGYGVIDAKQLAGALAHARAGTLPTRPDPTSAACTSRTSPTGCARSTTGSSHSPSRRASADARAPSGRSWRGPIGRYTRGTCGASAPVGWPAAAERLNGLPVQDVPPMARPGLEPGTPRLLGRQGAASNISQIRGVELKSFSSPSGR